MKRLLATTLMLASLSAFAHEPVYNQESIKVLQEHALTNVPPARKPSCSPLITPPARPPFPIAIRVYGGGLWVPGGRDHFAGQ